jgi:hypothetical protein
MALDSGPPQIGHRAPIHVLLQHSPNNCSNSTSQCSHNSGQLLPSIISAPAVPIIAPVVQDASPMPLLLLLPDHCLGGCSESAVAVAGSCTPICWESALQWHGASCRAGYCTVSCYYSDDRHSSIPSRCCDPDMAPPPAARNLKMGQGSGSSANLGLIGVCSAYTRTRTHSFPRSRSYRFFIMAMRFPLLLRCVG